MIGGTQRWRPFTCQVISFLGQAYCEEEDEYDYDSQWRVHDREELIIGFVYALLAGPESSCDVCEGLIFVFPPFFFLQNTIFKVPCHLSFCKLTDACALEISAG